MDSEKFNMWTQQLIYCIQRSCEIINLNFQAIQAVHEYMQKYFIAVSRKMHESNWSDKHTLASIQASQAGVTKLIWYKTNELIKISEYINGAKSRLQDYKDPYIQEHMEINKKLTCELVPGLQSNLQQLKELKREIKTITCDAYSQYFQKIKRKLSTKILKNIRELKKLIHLLLGCIQYFDLQLVNDEQ